MESSQRGRSPSAGHPSSARHTPAASPSPACRNLNSFAADTTTDLQSSTFASSNDFNLAASSASQQHSFNSAVDYNPAAQPLFPDQNFSSSGANLNQSDNSFPDFINFNPNQGLADSSFNNSLYTSSANDQSFGDATALDPALLDPQISPQSVPAANLFGQMATQNQQSPTPPHLLAPNMHRHSNSPHGSPAMGQGHFQNPSPNHSRHTSLDPSSAAYPQEQWGGGANFMGHRRTYSDAHSDVSSAQHSPYMPPADSFDHPGDHHSPNLGAQDPALFEGVMSMAHVSLSEASPSYISPAHSPHLSPALLPTQNHLPSFPQVDNYNLMHSMAPPMNHILPSSNVENFPEIRHDTPGQADAMSPPEISIQFAPPSRTTSFEPKENADGTGLTTPEKPRGRAKSDPFSSRGSAPARDLLSPAAAGVGSRSPSPSNKSRRSSTSSVPNRDYILDLADPSRPATNSNESGNSAKRTQKHPATFQCSLCPKRFTRAYNLRSHLRTHTDERPFVCSHCGKAFARQHDRKRHEGLHSGEKKFVCRGQLNDGNNWGCGRRFARADALGRHFRSEAGRVCIKPLMDEEARERDQPQAEPGSELGISIMPMPNQPMMAPQNGYGYGMPPHAGFQPGMHMQQQQMPVRLPAALLQQYPSLGGIWDNMAQNGPDEIEGEVSGRSSFDASSAGEYDEEDSYSYHQGGAMGWASDVGP